MSKTLHFSMGNIHLKELLYKKMGVALLCGERNHCGQELDDLELTNCCVI